MRQRTGARSSAGCQISCCGWDYALGGGGSGAVEREDGCWLIAAIIATCCATPAATSDVASIASTGEQEASA